MINRREVSASRAVYEIRTPENVAFRFERAGLASRAVAWLLDVAAMGALIQVASIVVSLLGWVLGELASALMLLAVFLVQWWYAAIAEWRFSGKTLGKWALGIRTIDASGLPLTLVQAAVRNLLRILDFLPGLYLVGGVTALLDPAGRRLGDLAAGTVVVCEQRLGVPARSFSALAGEVAGSVPGLAEAVAHLTGPERDAVFALVLQRDRLPLSVRVASFGRLATHLETRYGLSRPAHMSAEKLVLLIGAEVALATSRAKRPSRAQQLD